MTGLGRGSGRVALFGVVSLGLSLGVAACTNEDKPSAEDGPLDARAYISGMELDVQGSDRAAKTDVGKPVDISITIEWDTGGGATMPEDMTNAEEAALEEPKEFVWTVKPANGAKLSMPAGSPGDEHRPATFTATKPGK